MSEYSSINNLRDTICIFISSKISHAILKHESKETVSSHHKNNIVLKI